MRLKHALWTICLGALTWCTVAEARLRLCPGEFGFEAEWIYFRPSIDNAFFAQAGPGPFNLFDIDATLESNPFGYQSGYRLGAGYAFCACGMEARVRWTQHWATASRGLDEIAFVIPPLEDANRFSSANTGVKNHLDFYTFDATMGTTLFCDPCCFDLMIFGGLQYSAADGRERIKFLADNSGFTVPIIRVDYKVENCFYGIGPEMGVDFAYHLGCGVSVVGDARCSLLVSRMDLTRKFTTNNPGDPVSGSNQIERNWRIVPAYDIRFGLDYTYSCCGCLSFALEVGYEVISIQRALPFVPSAVKTFSIAGYSNVDFHGPYINGAVTF